MNATQLRASMCFDEDGRKYRREQFADVARSFLETVACDSASVLSEEVGVRRVAR